MKKNQNKSKGIFFISFMNLLTEPAITKKQMQELADKIEPIIKNIDCDVIIVDKPCMPIHRDNLKTYFNSLVKKIEDMEQ